MPWVVPTVAVATMPLLRARELAYPIEKARIYLALCDARLAAEITALDLRWRAGDKDLAEKLCSPLTDITDDADAPSDAA